MARPRIGTILPEGFRINRTSTRPFTAEEFLSLPQQQQILERAIGGTKYVSRRVQALSDETGLTPDQIEQYCESSAHILASPVSTEDRKSYGFIVRLREKYHLSESGEFAEPNLDFLGVLADTTYDVFLSYTHEDAPIALELREVFQQRKLTCFMAEKDVRAGAEWDDAIRNALVGSRFVVLLVTHRSKDKPWLFLEAGAGWALGKQIVPVLNMVAPSELIPLLSSRQARIVETWQQRDDLAGELAGLKG